MKNAIFAFLRISGMLYLIIQVNKMFGKVPILVFHDVSPKWNLYTEPVDPDNFEKIIYQLNRHYRIRPVEDLLRLNPNELRGSCFITFDDGLMSFEEYAFPVLKKYKVPTAMFLPTNCINENSTIWNYQLADLINRYNNSNLKFEIHGVNHIFQIVSKIDKIKAFNRLNDLLKEVDYDTIQNVLNQISIEDKNTETDFPLMQWPEIKKIAKMEFVKFYSHTHRHLYLPNQSENDIIFELLESRNILSKEFAISKNLLAYPVGGFNNAVLKLASQYFDMGFAVGDQMFNLKKLKSKKYIFEIPRFNIANQSSTELLLRINGFHNFIKKFKFS